MKKLLLVMICIFACVRAEAASSEDHVISRTPFQSHVEKVNRLINGSLGGAPIDPRSIVYIFDIHGTLTNKPDPTADGIEMPRQETITFLRALQAKGVSVTLSSAWDKPEDIIKSITICHLEDFLGTSESVTTSIPTPYGSDTFSIWRSGKVASVKRVDARSHDPYFRQKALAALFVRGGHLQPLNIFASLKIALEISLYSKMTHTVMLNTFLALKERDCGQV